MTNPCAPVISVFLRPCPLAVGEWTHTHDILNLACSANRSSPFHKKAERKLRVLGCKPNQTHVLIYPSCLHPTLMFLCSFVFKIPPVLSSLCSLVLKQHPVLSSYLLPDKLQLAHQSFHTQYEPNFFVFLIFLANFAS